MSLSRVQRVTVLSTEPLASLVPSQFHATVCTFKRGAHQLEMARFLASGRFGAYLRLVCDVVFLSFVVLEVSPHALNVRADLCRHLL